MGECKRSPEARCYEFVPVSEWCSECVTQVEALAQSVSRYATWRNDPSVCWLIRHRDLLLLQVRDLKQANAKVIREMYAQVRREVGQDPSTKCENYVEGVGNCLITYPKKPRFWCPGCVELVHVEARKEEKANSSLDIWLAESEKRNWWIRKNELFKRWVRGQ